MVTNSNEVIIEFLRRYRRAGTDRFVIALLFRILFIKKINYNKFTLKNNNNNHTLTIARLYFHQGQEQLQSSHHRQIYFH